MTQLNLGTIAGTTGGTLSAVLGYKTTSSILETIYLAGYGAIFSFTLTELLKWLWRWLKENFFNNKKQM